MRVRTLNLNLKLSKQRYHISLIMVLIILLISYSKTVYASSCNGKFVNPISDICWSCLLPISFGDVRLGDSNQIKNRDTRNPSNILCKCIKGLNPLPGITVGFWEPVRLVDVTRTPYCLVNLGGISLGSNPLMQGTHQHKIKSLKKYGFYHTHYYIYPLIYWLELLTDFACLESSTFDVAYVSELDPTYNKPKLSMILHPEVFLFANPISQLACSADCVASNVSFGSNAMFWCGGCHGSIYPFSGYVGSFHGGIQASSLLTYRAIAKMHRLGLAHETSTYDGSINGSLCRKNLALKIKKDQYKIQITYPIPSSTGFNACVPLGMSEVFYGAAKEFPGAGEDFGYLIWRKKNCCLLN